MKKLLAYLAFGVFALSLGFGVVSAQDSGKLKELEGQIAEYAENIKRLQGEAATLGNQIATFNANISLTELKIDQTQEQILLLGGRIDQLDVSLKDLSDAFSSRVAETYKMSRVNESYFAFSSNDINRLISRFYYLRKIQEADRSLISRLESAQSSYKTQKGQLEVLDAELAGQRQVLSSQKAAKDNLLAITKNDEKNFQSLLSKARSEFEAIQAIIAGRGDETEVGKVATGQRIASIIQGASCNSSGGHLHFIVSKEGSTQNPFSHLKPGVDHENCSGPGKCSAGDPFNPSGSWEWPVNPQIHYVQGYGNTWAVNNIPWIGRIYNFHNGIDIDSNSSSEVRAAQAGILYQGSFSGSGGCRLRYVRVDHDGSDLDTFYLHINY